MGEKMIDTLPKKLESFLLHFKDDFEEYFNFGKISRAFELNQLISENPKSKVRYDMPPNPFYGNLLAETVVVNLNPGIEEDKVETAIDLKGKGINDFKDYYNYLINFGEIRYKDGSSIDNFDTKQVAFLLPYDEKTTAIGFDFYKDTKTTITTLSNLRKLLSNRCQLELIPYGSTVFDKKQFKHDMLQAYFRKIIDVITCVERKIIFFNGVIFRELLKRFKYEFQIDMSPKYVTKLIKKDGSITKNNYSYSHGTLKYNKQTVKFIIADTFSQQGLNGDLMRNYGEFVIRDL